MSAKIDEVVEMRTGVVRVRDRLGIAFKHQWQKRAVTPMSKRGWMKAVMIASYMRGFFNVKSKGYWCIGISV